MTSRPLPNYLKSYRKQSGLTQSEMAFLLGTQDGARFSRYEQDRVVPSVRTALAFAAILKKPVEKLFAGALQDVEIETEKKIRALIQELKETASPGDTAANKRKLQWLTENHGALPDQPETISQT